MGLVIDKEQLLAAYPTCYACDQPKVSREHVPPLCFFPEEKDSAGVAVYRKNLIKVPSCELHNTAKSSDDFYAAFHLASTIRGNRCAELVRDGVIARTIERDQRERGAALTKRLLAQVRGVVGENVYGEVDPRRMVRFLDLCARGVYFYEKLKPLELPLRIANVDFDLPDPARKEQMRVYTESFADEMEGCEHHGSNPDVFKYAICEKPEKGVTMVEMVFFGELYRWAFYHPNAERQVF
jgi:hypothetical protein